MKEIKLVVSKRGVLLNGKKVASYVLERIKGLLSYKPTPKEAEEIGPENKLIIGDKVVVNLPGNAPIQIVITGDVFGKIDLSSCNLLEIKGSMRGNINVSSGNIVVNESLSGDITSGVSHIEVGEEINGDIKISAGTVTRLK